MFSAEINQLIRQEQHKDRLRQIEKQMLIQTMGRSAATERAHHQAIYWLGHQLIQWGEWLQQSHSPAAGQPHLRIKMK